MHQGKAVLIGAVFGCLMTTLSHTSVADEVTDSIEEALQAYQNGEHDNAVDSLNYATELIQQKKGEDLAGFLPEPIDDWSAEPASSEAAGALMFGGGITAARQYRKERASVRVSIVTDSPLMHGVMMMLSNPMVMSATSGRMERINGQKMLVNHQAEVHRGEIQAVIANRFFLTIEGSGVTVEELKAYAEAIDYKGLTALP